MGEQLDAERLAVLPATRTHDTEVSRPSSQRKYRIAKVRQLLLPQMPNTPAGFEQIDVGHGFMTVFGPVYLHRATRTLAFRVAEHHLNPVQACNGGAMATFVDLQIVAVLEGPGTSEGHAPTVSLNVDYLGTAKLGDWVEAPVVLIKQTRNLVFTQTVAAVAGQPVARASAIYRRYPSAR